MTPPQRYKTPAPKDWAFFVFLFIVCVAGSAGIFWFAAGVENGNRIMEGFLRSLLSHAPAIVGILVVFNVLLVLHYSRKS